MTRTPVECPREQDVLDAIAACRWPDRCDADLRAHVERCPVCADLAAVASALGEERDRWWERAELPSASLVWWRAELRARAEAARVVSRPVVAAQVVGVAILVAVAVAWLAAMPAAWSWPPLVEHGWQALATALAGMPTSAQAMPGVRWALWVAAGAGLVAVPAALYLGFRD
ncbi:MAG: hypothetical protein MUF60_05460 [Vicinamibacterales bacterium]|jgi:hypothetical protein|nr:hypothetical protein [Vicinamibacterales bacterium]